MSEVLQTVTHYEYDMTTSKLITKQYDYVHTVGGCDVYCDGHFTAALNMLCTDKVLCMTRARDAMRKRFTDINDHRDQLEKKANQYHEAIVLINRELKGAKLEKV